MSIIILGTDFNAFILEDVSDRLPVFVGDPLQVPFQDGTIILRLAREIPRQESIKKLLDRFHNPLPAIMNLPI